MSVSFMRMHLILRKLVGYKTLMPYYSSLDRSPYSVVIHRVYNCVLSCIYSAVNSLYNVPSLGKSEGNIFTNARMLKKKRRNIRAQSTSDLYSTQTVAQIYRIEA